MSQRAPLGGLVVWRRSGLVDTSEKRGQLGAAACGPFSELSELNPNLEIDDICGGIAQQVSCSDVESRSVGVLISELLLVVVLARAYLWMILCRPCSVAFAGAYTRLRKGKGGRRVGRDFKGWSGVWCGAPTCVVYAPADTTDQTRCLYTPYTPHTSNKHTPGHRDSDFITPSVAPDFAIGTWELPWP
ncbi:hypothetical protein C8J57DRAFT_1571198 [Mycena rebaudengoi]|nr:hypothetical protein C8J57DRAFT_1571198 [Mycena rebaudengoi]